MATTHFGLVSVTQSVLIVSRIHTAHSLLMQEIVAIIPVDFPSKRLGWIVNLTHLSVVVDKVSMS